MVARKPLISKSKEKEVPTTLPKKVNAKLNVEGLQNAVVDGMLVVPLESEVIVVKSVNGKVQKSSCIIKRIEENTVHAWDETLERWYLFNPTEVEKKGLIIKISKMATSSP